MDISCHRPMAHGSSCGRWWKNAQVPRSNMEGSRNYMWVDGNVSLISFFSGKGPVPCAFTRCRHGPGGGGCRADSTSCIAFGIHADFRAALAFALREPSQGTPQQVRLLYFIYSTGSMDPSRPYGVADYSIRSSLSTRSVRIEDITLHPPNVAK
jgi:hypothetical protein